MACAVRMALPHEQAGGLHLQLRSPNVWHPAAADALPADACQLQRACPAARRSSWPTASSTR